MARTSTRGAGRSVAADPPPPQPPDASTFRILLDVPVSSDLALGFPEVAKAFGEIINHSAPQFAIGIFGGWGAGKTTLMQEIQRNLDPKATAVVWFSAWRYQKEEHLIVPLLDVIREAVADWAARSRSEKFRRAANRLAATIGRVSISLMSGLSMRVGLPGAQVSYDAGKALTRAATYDEEERAARTPTSFYHAGFTALKQGFEEFRKVGAKRIVVFVDDLDRCLPEGALDVLESMKLFFDLEGFVFVVGLDREIVEMSLEKRFHDMRPDTSGDLDGAHQARLRADGYLQKIFQVPYSLAPVSGDNIGDYLRTIRKTAGLETAQMVEIDTVVKPFLDYLVSDAGLNPREFKRFINSYTMQRKMNGAQDREIILALQTLAFRGDWADVQVVLLSLRKVFLDAVAAYAAKNDSQKLAALMPGFAPPPASFLKFVTAGEPGHCLVTFAKSGRNIEPFIEMGEASRSPDGTIFSELFAALGEIAQSLESYRRGTSEFGKLKNEFKTRIGSVGSMARSHSGLSIRRLGEDVAAFSVDLSNLENVRCFPDRDANSRNRSNFTDMSPEGQAAIERMSQRLLDVQQGLQRAYRSGI